MEVADWIKEQSRRDTKIWRFLLDVLGGKTLIKWYGYNFSRNAKRTSSFSTSTTSSSPSTAGVVSVLLQVYFIYNPHR